MPLLKRFVSGLMVGAALVALALWAMPPAAESAASPPVTPIPETPTHPALPPLPGAPGVSGPLPPSAPLVVPTPPEVTFPPVFPGPALRPSNDALPVIKPVETKELLKPPPGRTAIRVSGPSGMKVSWLIGTTFHDRDLTAPAAYNFVQGQVYRLRLAGMTKYPQTKFYPTLEVAAPNEKATTFLAHNAIPLTFTEAELASAAEGRLVVKAVYLPTVADGQPSAPDEVSSVRLGATADAVAVASGRGVLLAVVRLGNVDLENPDSPPLTAPAAPEGATTARMPPATEPNFGAVTSR